MPERGEKDAAGDLGNAERGGLLALGCRCRRDFLIRLRMKACRMQAPLTWRMDFGASVIIAAPSSTKPSLFDYGSCLCRRCSQLTILGAQPGSFNIALVRLEAATTQSAF